MFSEKWSGIRTPGSFHIAVSPVERFRDNLFIPEYSFSFSLVLLCSVVFVCLIRRVRG